MNMMLEIVRKYFIFLMRNSLVFYWHETYLWVPCTELFNGWIDDLEVSSS